MLIIPAIDIINGECVRLTQGDYARKKIYSKKPLEAASDFVLAGAKFLHVVDLDGAKSGRPENQNLIIEMCRKINIPIQGGGGIREISDIKKYLDAGIERVILGTKAIKDPDFLKEALRLFGCDKLVVALDVKNGRLRDIGKNGLLFCFRFGLGKLINVIYLFIFGSMFKKKLVDAVRQT